MKKEWFAEKIAVECYAGYKGEESPRAFTYLGKRYEIQEILDRWDEEGRSPEGLRQEYFKVKTPDGGVFLMRYTPALQSWALFRHLPVPRFSNN
jgi:hypothetical protein